ncbi:coilin [Halichoeres trimaculatus]|uniref:coilin n=1 Tax=Halichoeres trimaculatus TaxID=147232 RepID=UPI003D9F658D
MATHSNNFIRVRLHFEYPPPAVVDCRMCWLLVDLNRCRVVADLESVIREKFEFGRRSILSLFIEDCYLPHTESVYVVRDNDSVRVKVDHLAQVNGHSTSPLTDGSKKRQRPTEEDEVEDKQKKKKRKKRSEESQERDAKQADGDDGNNKSLEKQKKKKKRKEVDTVTSTKKTSVSVKSPKKPPPAAKTQKVSSSSDSSSSEEEDKAPKKTSSVNPPAKSTKKPPPAAKTQKASSSDSSSDSEEEDEAPKKPAPRKPAPKPPSAASKVPSITKPTLKKINPPSSTSSDSSSDEEESVKNLPKKKLFPSASPTTSENVKLRQASSSLSLTNCAQKPAVSALPPGGKTVQDTSSDSEEEIQLVIRRPLPAAQQLGRGAGSQAPWRGRGRGRGSTADAERGRGGGRGGRRGHSNSFEYNYNGFKEPSTETDTLTNFSVVVQNGAESLPIPDYSSMPLLAAPPLVGQKIAFKLLELTENYTPEVSEYKEGKIVSFDPTTKQVELELLRASHAPVEPGKFDLVYQNEDGSERVEYAVSRGSKVTERWDSLLEPRLII